MMILKYLLCFVLAFMFLACASATLSQSRIVESEKQITVDNLSETDRYAVYDALIKVLSKDLFVKSSSLVIIGRTNIDHRDDPMLNTVLANVKKELPSLSEGMIEEFLTKNKTRVPLKDSFNLPAKRIFISDEELKTTLNDKLNWKAFYQKYPNSQGVMTLSNVGFDADVKRAFVYVANTRGSLDGVGLYVVLEKQGKLWKVKEKATGWMS